MARGPKPKRPRIPSDGVRSKWSSKNNVGSFIPPTAAEAIGKQGKPQSMVNAYWNVNPHYDRTYNEFTKNCQRCVFAYELNRRGYDVEALPTYKGDTMPMGNRWATALKGMKEDIVGARSVDKTIENIKKQMESYGNGSRAIIAVDWAGHNSGHVFNVEYKDGVLYAYDPQNKRQLTGTALLRHYLPFTTMSRTSLWRTDDKDIAENMRYMVRARG